MLLNFSVVLECYKLFSAHVDDETGRSPLKRAGVQGMQVTLRSLQVCIAYG
jgi:hypothetical protein